MKTRRSDELCANIGKAMRHLISLAGACLLLAATIQVANSQTDDFTWNRPAAQGNGNWSATTNWVGPSARYPDDPDERAIFNDPTNMGMPIQNASMSNGLGQLVFNYTGWTVYVEDPLRFNSVTHFSYNAMYCYATGGAGVITIYPQVELLGASQNIYTASGATLVLASPSSGFIGSYGPTISSVNPTAEDTGAVRIDVSSSTTGPFYLRQGTLLLRHSGALGQSTATVNIGGDQWTTDGANARLLADVSGISVDKNLRVRSYPSRNVNATIGGSHATGSSSFTGTLILDLSANLTAAGTSTVNFTGQITGTGGVTKTGSGTVVLSSGANNYQGATTIQSGTLRLGASGALPANTNVTLANVSGAMLDLNGYSHSLASLNGGGSSGGNVALGSAQLTVGGGSYAGVISGPSGSLRKVGAGTLVLSGANTYTGSTLIEGGTLRLGAPGALPSGTSLTLENAAGAVLDLDGYWQTIASLNGGGSSGGNVALGSAQLTVGSGSFAGVISGAGGSLRKVGSGTLVLSGANTYSGATLIDGGTLRLGAVGALPGVSAVSLANAAGVALDLNGYSQTIMSLAGGGPSGGNVLLGSAELTVAGGSYAGSIYGLGGSLRKVGLGELTLSGYNYYTGSTRIDGGTLRTGAVGALPSGTSVVLANSPAVVLDLDGYGQTIDSLQGGGPAGGNVLLGGAGLSVCGGMFAGSLSGDGSLTKLGHGKTLLLSGSNTYKGPTLIKEGVLKLDANQALPTDTTVLLSNTAGAALDLGGYQQTIATLAGGGPIGGDVLLGAGLLTVGSGEFAGAISGSGGLTKANDGVLTLSGRLAYAGPTTVKQGTLLLNGVHSGAGTYTVRPGATLGGFGRTDGDVMVQPGGMLSPGMSIGKFSIRGDVQLAGTLLIELDPALPQPVDHLLVESTLDISTAAVEFRVSGTPTGPAYVFATYGTLVGEQFAEVRHLPDGYWIDYNFQGANQIALVPEPAAISLLALAGAALLVGRMWRRRPKW